MTQSNNQSPKKPPLPIPPLNPQKSRPLNPNMDDEDGPTRVSMGKPPLMSNKKTLKLPDDLPPAPDFDDLPEFDDADDLELETDEPTQIGLGGGQLPPLNSPTNKAVPPLTNNPMRPSSGQNSSDTTNVASSPTIPMGTRSQPPANAPIRGNQGETNVRAPGRMAGRPPVNFNAGPRRTYGPTSSANVGRSPGQPTLAELVKIAYDSGYSDVHLGVGELPRMRDRGEMMVLDKYPEIDSNTFMSWMREILKEEEIQKFKKELEFDGATQYDFARVRINIFDTLRGNAMVLRLIPLKILTMEQLRLPNICRDICEAHKGLILITGPTGSGKSTTLAAMIDYINKEQAKHIITIEDPVEFVHKSHKSLVKQREVGMHTLKFDNALKASLREDPDIILVGEMRDKSTVNTALKAAQTGHLVMGTLHTNSAIKTLERIFTLYTAEEQPAIRSAVAESLVCIIAQGLCRTTDGKRAAYHDILINTETVKDYILSNKYEDINGLMEEGEFDGMITMNRSLFNLYQEGRITEETALERSPTRNEMAMMLRGRI